MGKKNMCKVSPGGEVFSKMTSRGQSPPPPTTPAPPGVARLGEGFRKWRATLPYGVKVGARGEAPRFRGEAWGQQGQAGRESAWQRVGFPDPGALRIPLVSKFPLGSASARSRPGPSSAARDTGGSGRGAGRRGEGRKAGRAPAPALPAGRARPSRPAVPGRGLRPGGRPAGPSCKPLRALGSRGRDADLEPRNPFLKKPVLTARC